MKQMKLKRLSDLFKVTQGVENREDLCVLDPHSLAPRLDVSRNFEPSSLTRSYQSFFHDLS